jgi:ferrous iron transport protein B
VDKPLIVALNIWDETRHKGIDIDVDALSRVLGVPVVPTAGRSGYGLQQLLARLGEAKSPRHERLSADERWTLIGKIVAETQHLTHRHHTFLERLEDASIHPVGGFFVAAAVLVLSFSLVRLIGEMLIRLVMDPLFHKLYLPLVDTVSNQTASNEFLHSILIGHLVDGQVDFMQSFGLLTTALYVPLGMVLPYVLAFYFVLGLLEDIGYLPRLAILLDGFMHRLGLHGYTIIPTLLGLGCNVPALLATRILESRRERFIVATTISIAVPCVSLQAMIVGLLGHYGMRYVAFVYGVLFLVWLILGLIMKAATRGILPALLIEIPPYRQPHLRSLLVKFRMRSFGFLKEALPVVLIGVVVINLFYALGILDTLANVTAPIVTKVLGLPKEAVLAIIVGFLRKDIGVGMLAPLGLSVKQLIIGCTTLAMFFPCIATFVILFKELGTLDTVKSIGVMVATSLVVGGILNIVL